MRVSGLNTVRIQRCTSIMTGPTYWVLPRLGLLKGAPIDLIALRVQTREQRPLLRFQTREIQYRYFLYRRQKSKDREATQRVDKQVRRATILELVMGKRGVSRTQQLEPPSGACPVETGITEGGAGWREVEPQGRGLLTALSFLYASLTFTQLT